jgi:hypothetical protein
MVVRIIKKGNSIVEKKVEPTVHKVFKVGKMEPNLRQRGVIASVGKGRKSKAQILRENGYAPSTVDHPKRVFDKPVIQAGINPIIAKIAKNRDKIVDALSKKDFKKQSPFNLSVMMNMHNKDVNLLSGLPTDRTEYILPDDEKARLDKLLEMNKKK